MNGNLKNSADTVQKIKGLVNRAIAEYLEKNNMNQSNELEEKKEKYLESMKKSSEMKKEQITPGKLTEDRYAPFGKKI